MLPENVIVNIFNGEVILVDKTTAVLASSANDQTNNAVYEYSVWANLGEKLTFVPLDPRYMPLAGSFSIFFTVKLMSL